MHSSSARLWMGVILAIGLAVGSFFLFYGNDNGEEALSNNEIVTTGTGAEFIHSGEAIRLEILEGSSVRYLVGEQLARRDLPNDAIGITSEVIGEIFLDKSGVVDKDNSKIVVKLDSLESDDSRRDNYLKTRTLIGSAQFPEAIFIPEEVSGLDWPIKEGGQLVFEMVGEMAIRGTTKPMTWTVEAILEKGLITGHADTRFYFSDYGIPKPTLLFILSMDDEIRLEADIIMRVTEQ